MEINEENCKLFEIGRNVSAQETKETNKQKNKIIY